MTFESFLRAALEKDNVNFVITAGFDEKGRAGFRAKSLGGERDACFVADGNTLDKVDLVC